MRWVEVIVVVILSACGSSKGEDAEARARRAKEEAVIVEPMDPDRELWALRQRVAKAEIDAKAKGLVDHAAKLAALSKELGVLQRDLVDLDKKVGVAVDAVVAAQTDAEREAAHARVRDPQREMYQRIAAAKVKVAL